jgi:hypothetical protein
MNEQGTKMKYEVSMEEVRPGWDEFGKVRTFDVVVEANSKEEAMELADEKHDKYTRAYMVRALED